MKIDMMRSLCICAKSRHVHAAEVGGGRREGGVNSCFRGCHAVLMILLIDRAEISEQ